MMKTDLSEQAVTLRLKQVSRLRRVCLSLGKAGLVNRSESDREDHEDLIAGKLKFSHRCREAPPSASSCQFKRLVR
jgi:hypothetical protein